MRPQDLLNRLNDQPFKPFRVHLSDGSMLDVPQAAMVIVGRSSAVLPSQFTHESDGTSLAERWRTIALVHIVQFSDLDERVDGQTQTSS